jgi:8-oxo-dGTP diphosphatase
MLEKVSKVYGNRLRVRVCGLLHNHEGLLLVNHRLPGRSAWWAPPGGGVEFGESLEGTLVREFEEETNLKISVGQFAFGCEFLHEPLHAIELFFWVTCIGGVLQAGQDPELPLISGVRFMKEHEIASLPRDALHGILDVAPAEKGLQQLKGFIRI